MTQTDQRSRRESTLVRYRSLYEVADEHVDAVVAAVFAADARIESDTLDVVVTGHAAIAEHVRSIRASLVQSTIRYVTDVQWSHRTARWCWRWSGPSGSHRGMDMAHLTTDGDRIEILSIFSGLLPPPAS